MSKLNPVGKVWLVGAGPGKAELLTIKAYKTIQQADLILFDHLISDEIKELFPRATPAFYVGKVKNNHSIPQNELNSLLVKKAKEGKQVVRLKGGDPFVFGRGAEELEVLLKAGVHAEVVAGLTSASGCTTAVDIPLTSRGYTQGCTFVTAHAESSLRLNWQALAQLQQTIVFYMGVSRANFISEQLIKNGLSGQTPCAIVEKGCRDQQRVITGTVKELHMLVEKNGVESPAIIIVGEVVKLGEKLAQLRQSLNQSEFENQLVAHQCA